MPRTRVPDPCLICSEVNCSCGKPAKEPKAPKVARKRAPKVEAPAAPAVPPEPVQQAPVLAHPIDAAPTAKADARAAMKARAARSRATSATPDPDRVMDEAIRALAPILSEDEKKNHAHVLWAIPTSPSDRALAWRQRRASVNTNTN